MICITSFRCCEDACAQWSFVVCDLSCFIFYLRGGQGFKKSKLSILFLDTLTHNSAEIGNVQPTCRNLLGHRALQDRREESQAERSYEAKMECNSKPFAMQSLLMTSCDKILKFVKVFSLTSCSKSCGMASTVSHQSEIRRLPPPVE